VLNASAGWVVNVGRTVIGGARLEHGVWLSWRPPPVSGGGGVALAAARSMQLAAVCDEGEWFNFPPHVAVYFSSTAGDTLTPARTQPAIMAVGGMASPGPGDVVVATADRGGNDLLVATSNPGASRAAVYEVNSQAPETDFGFTSRAQGVVIIGGAWRPVAHCS
jgi:hypothetical protein